MNCAPNIREFNAWINLQPPGPSKLLVVGEVETNSGTMLPSLTRAAPQGINPQQLILDLTIADTGGIGTQDVNFRRARYEEEASAGQFTSVAIRWNGDIISILNISEVQ